MALSQNLELLELRFLGARNGSSTSHTNAFFMPDSETLVLIDLSLLNVQKAQRIIQRYRDRLTRVIICLTHTHADHVSGVSMLAYVVEHLLSEVRLEIIADSRVLLAARSILDAEGAKEADGIVVYRAPDIKKFAWDGQEPIPANYHWFGRAIPTEHDRNLLAATGFLFRVNGKAVVYSGDTNTLEPFEHQVWAIAEEETDHRKTPIELYLEVQNKKWPAHLYFPEIQPRVEEMLREIPQLNVIFMHYDNYRQLRWACTSFPEELQERVWIAK